MIDYAQSPDQWHWGPYFSVTEFACKGNGQCLMDATFMDMLVGLRKEYGSPLMVSSGYRSPEYNQQVSDTGAGGPHTLGRAVDFHIEGPQAYKLLIIALNRGFTGIGVSQKGASRFLHLDNLQAPAFPRPTIWSY